MCEPQVEDRMHGPLWVPFNVWAVGTALSFHFRPLQHLQ